MDERSEALVLLVTTAGGDDVGALTLTVWDAAVPALPFAAKILPAASLAVGACRRRCRR